MRSSTSLYLYSLYLEIQPTIPFQNSCLYEETAWRASNFMSLLLSFNTLNLSTPAAYIGLHAFPFKRLTYRYQLLLIIIFYITYTARYC